jgi:signal transduction histidine kinase
MMQSEPVGIALNCDVEGRIINVVLDKIGVNEVENQTEQTIFDYIDAGSVEKTRLFLKDVNTNQACFDWEINFKVAGGVETLHLAGAILDEKLLVVGTRDSQNLMPLFEEMMRINNQQVNAFRSLYKDQLDSARKKTERDEELFDDLSRLNNELVQLQRELAKKNEVLARLNEQKNQFLGIAAHDLRNPLSAITAYSGLLLDEAQEILDEEQLEFLSIIQTSSDFMLRLINDLLDVSRIEAGKLNLEIVPSGFC